MYLDEVIWDGPPVLYWRLGDSGAIAADSSGNGRTGTYGGTYSQSVAGALVGDSNTAVDFAGTGQVTRADEAALDLTGACTLECWVKMNALTGANTRLLSKTFAYEVIVLGSGSGRIQFKTYHPAEHNVTTDAGALGELAVAGWAHVCCTWDGSTKRIYINGIERKNGTTAGNLQNSAFALAVASTSSSTSRSDAVMDEVAVYNTALSAARIRRHYEEGLAATHAPKLQCQAAFTTNPGATPAWTDISDYVLGAYTRRGRQHELGRMETGTATITLDNRDRRFDNTYTSGAYYPNVLPMRRVRLRALWAGTWYPVFDGYAESWLPIWPAGRDAHVNLTLTDGMKVLAQPSISASYSQELSSVRVSNVLDAIAWPAADRSIEAGKSTMQAAAVSGNALDHLQVVEQSENGLLFVDGQGRVVFHNRHHRVVSQSASQGTFGDASGELPYADLQPSYDDNDIRNDVRVTRVGGAQQTAIDATSQTTYLTRTLERTGLLMTGDPEALNAAQWLLAQYKEPDLRFKSIELRGRMDNTLWPKVLGLELGDRITVNRRPPGGGNVLTKDCHIEGITHSVSHGEWATVWQLSPASPQAWWVLGDAQNSQLGVSTRLAY